MGPRYPYWDEGKMEENAEARLRVQRRYDKLDAGPTVRTRAVPDTQEATEALDDLVKSVFHITHMDEISVATRKYSRSTWKPNTGRRLKKLCVRAETQAFPYLLAQVTFASVRMPSRIVAMAVLSSSLYVSSQCLALATSSGFLRVCTLDR
jgi:hypothetical protein